VGLLALLSSPSSLTCSPPQLVIYVLTFFHRRPFYTADGLIQPEYTGGGHICHQVVSSSMNPRQKRKEGSRRIGECWSRGISMLQVSLPILCLTLITCRWFTLMPSESAGLPLASLSRTPWRVLPSPFEEGQGFNITQPRAQLEGTHTHAHTHMHTHTRTHTNTHTGMRAAKLAEVDAAAQFVPEERSPGAGTSDWSYFTSDSAVYVLTTIGREEERGYPSLWNLAQLGALAHCCCAFITMLLHCCYTVVKILSSTLWNLAQLGRHKREYSSYSCYLVHRFLEAIL
jgi:hypothetical protein